MNEPVNIQELNQRIERESAVVDALIMEMRKNIVGQKHMVESLMIGLLSNGHVLLEGVPGLAKTLTITSSYFSTPSQLVIGCHSTITSDAQRPTNFSNMSNLSEVNMLALFASALSQNALVIVPDYEGYGITADIPHPYCNRDLTALQVVTGAKAGLSWFEENEMKMADG